MPVKPETEQPGKPETLTPAAPKQDLRFQKVPAKRNTKQPVNFFSPR
jgi:hypothetical protein